MSGRHGIAKSRWLPAYVAVYLAFLYLPILLLPIFSFNNAAATTFPLAGFTTKWYASLWSNSVMLEAARNLEFEQAARLRDQLALLKEQAFGAVVHDHVVVKPDA